MVSWGGLGGGQAAVSTQRWLRKVLLLTLALAYVPVFRSCSLVLGFGLSCTLLGECGSPSQDTGVLGKSAGIPISARVNGHLFALSPKILVAKGASVNTYSQFITFLLTCGLRLWAADERKYWIALKYATFFIANVSLRRICTSQTVPASKMCIS